MGLAPQSRRTLQHVVHAAPAIDQQRQGRRPALYFYCEPGRDSGEEAGFAADACLAILDHFLKETAPSGSASNSPGSLPKTKPEGAHEEE